MSGNHAGALPLAGLVAARRSEESLQSHRGRLGPGNHVHPDPQRLPRRRHRQTSRWALVHSPVLSGPLRLHAFTQHPRYAEIGSWGSTHRRRRMSFYSVEILLILSHVHRVATGSMIPEQGNAAALRDNRLGGKCVAGSAQGTTTVARMQRHYCASFRRKPALLAIRQAMVIHA